MSEDTNSKIENLRTLARRARNDQGNDNAAKGYYDKILLENPNDWEAYFFSSTFGYVDQFVHGDFDAILQNDQILSQEFIINEGILDRAEGCLKSTMKLLKDQHPDSQCTEELEEIYTELGRLSGLTKATLIGLVAAFSTDPNWVFAIPLAVSEYIVKMNDTDMKLFLTFGKLSKELFDNDEMSFKGYNFVKNWVDTIMGADYYPQLTNDAKKHIRKSNKDAEAALKPIREKRIAQYWEDHPEKKAELDSEKEELEKKKQQLKSKLGSIKSENNYEGLIITLNNYNTQLKDQRAELNRLGLFKKKEKLALQERISQTQTSISATQGLIDELDGQIKPLEKELSSVEKSLLKNNLKYKEIEDSLMSAEI